MSSLRTLRTDLPSVRACAPLFVAAALCLVSELPAQRVVDPDDAVFQNRQDEENARGERDMELVRLSPFTVSTDRDSGYFSANTLAGSRMNTNLADLAASISVINAQQFEDTASTDINDIFRYEVNTEGSLTYTPETQSMRNDGVLDVIAGGTVGSDTTPFTNAGANRVRGLGSPSRALNYYPANGAVGFDSYNTQSVEISRGPNSMLFGLGNPAGIVNQSTAQAQLNKRNAKVALRADQYGSFRSSVSFNQPLLEDRLAIYGAALWDDRRFDRKPAYDRTDRVYGALTFKPFAKTTLRANAERFNNQNRRPNTLTPRDFVSEWNKAGRPYYDSNTKKIYSLDTGEELGMRVNSADSPFADSLRDFIESRPGFDAALWNGDKTRYNNINIFGNNSWAIPANWVAGQPSPNILFVPGIGEVNQGRSVMQIADGQLVDWFRPSWQYRYRPGFGTQLDPAANPGLYPALADIYANPDWADVFTRTYTSSAGWSAAGNGYGSYRYPGVTDSSIYNWRDININSMNFGTAKNTTVNLEFEQELPHDLHFSGGWLRQSFARRTNYTVAQLNVATLFVDTNLNRLDGTPNPYFGLPYVEDQDPDSYVNKSLDDHYRALLAWTPDFTRRSGWLRHLGRHQVLGMWSKDKYMATNIRQRLHYIDSASPEGAYRYMNNPNNRADGTPTGWSYQSTSLRRTYYLGAPGDPLGTVSRPAGSWDHLSYSGGVRTYDYDASAFVPLGMTTEFTDFDAGTGRSQRAVETLSAGITSNFWGGRIVTTFGFREDTYKARDTNSGLGAVRDAEGNIVAPAITNADKWVNGVYQRDLIFNRWGPYNELTGRTKTAGGVFRPFKGWGAIEAGADSGSLFWQFVRGLGFSYNQSDNFNPPAAARGDFYGNALPKPTGKGKDYGIQFSLFDNKLFGRVTRFEASNQDENIAAPNAFNRLRDNIDHTLFRNWARTLALINLGRDPTDQDFTANITQVEEDAIRANVDQVWGLPYDYYGSLPYGLGATRNAEARGFEAEINYNPTRSWTMKFTLGKQQTRYASVLKEYAPWEAERMSVWQAARASDYLLPQYQHLATYTTAGGREVDLTEFWSSYGYNANLFPDQANGYAHPEAYYEGILAPQVAFDRDLEGQTVRGQRKYRWSFLTNYRFMEGPLKGLGIGGSQRWEDKAILGYYGKASGANFYNGEPVIDMSDITRPIYDSSNTYTDLWISYTRPILRGTVGMKIQLNINNVFESGSLRPVGVNYDGSPYSFRIIDPRQFVLTTTFDF